jgi:hypothetical protein
VLLRASVYLPLAYVLILVFQKANLMNNGIADTIAFVSFEIITVGAIVFIFEVRLAGKKLSTAIRDIARKMGISRPESKEIDKKQ